MQTNFTAEQLEDPKLAHANTILRTCVHCGFCLATCPTYVLLGDELDSPRGRIYLMKQMLETGKPATPEVVKHIDRCLSCLSCMSTCPSGVHYMHLVDEGRAHIERTFRRPFLDRLIRNALAAVIPEPGRFRAAITLSRLGRPLAPLLRRIPGLQPMAAMLDLAPRRLAPLSAAVRRGLHSPAGKVRARMVLLTGCVQDVLDPAINAATVRLLNRLGVEVVVPAAMGCCGSATQHMGKEDDALARARRNIDAWIAEMDGSGLDAIVANASGCGTTIKDYGHMLRLDPAYAEKAERVSALARDVSEVLLALGLPEARAPRALRVAYHSPCSMQHGQQVRTEPKTLLAAAGFEVVDVPEGHLCCGSAGTYNILQPGIASRLRARKVANIEQTAPDVIATGNLGCITQIAGGTRIPIVHTVELLDWASGGPEPSALREPA
ncbi:MAG TPA: glycolate oxidase subunit GlcF [Aestuariivirgaceae bacterium]|nr:glycolate oxidase subunit GlcF [Aestuariivirgaceae bacterium]